MNEAFFAEVSAWLMQAGLAGKPETEILSGFCERSTAAGIPLGRSLAFIDTLHPVHEGRLFRWGYGPDEAALLEYGRTSPEGLVAAGSNPDAVAAAERWRRSPFYKMLQTGESYLRRRLNAASGDEFSFVADFLTAGMTDYVAIICRFAADGIIGEMDGVYSSWTTAAADGFNETQIAALKRTVPYLALTIKSVALARMTGTLMETYLGRDAGQRVLAGRIVRGVAERIDAVIWFSDLRGFTRTTDTAPGQVNRRGSPSRLQRGVVGGQSGTPERGRTQATPRGCQSAGHRHVSWPACRRSVLRQYRQPRPARLHRRRPGRERSEPHCGDVPFGRSAGADVGRLCRCRRHQAPLGFGRPLRTARRVAPPGTVHARSRRVRGARYGS